mmetsp:Transcript_18029/g.43402  ORF Transcript_18029/g.43402 Transcript_18029/m.43402 type:complete len:93 (+) Transcript_18029:1075-1353(+)
MGMRVLTWSKTAGNTRDDEDRQATRGRKGAHVCLRIHDCILLSLSIHSSIHAMPCHPMPCHAIRAPTHFEAPRQSCHAYHHLSLSLSPPDGN